jgi:hypothetical protein
VEPEPLRLRRLADRGPEHEREHHDEYDHRHAENEERTAFARPGPWLGGIGIERRRRLARDLVLALEDDGLVLDRSLFLHDADSIPGS